MVFVLCNIHDTIFLKFTIKLSNTIVTLRLQRYSELIRTNITISRFLLVADYQCFKVIVGNVILS
nr:MAG TPA: hypothetical protein [Caudoviricetes sp.]